jgi:hypothetical protein
MGAKAARDIQTDDQQVRGMDASIPPRSYIFWLDPALSTANPRSGPLHSFS